MAIVKVGLIRYVRFDVKPLKRNKSYIENSKIDLYNFEDEDKKPKSHLRFRFKANQIEHLNPTEEVVGILVEMDFQINFENNEQDKKDCHKLADHFIVNFKAKYREKASWPMTFSLPSSDRIAEMIFHERNPE